MAKKRMFSREVLFTDKFTYLSHSAMALYIYANMDADDNGFVDNILGLARMIRASERDVKELIEQGFFLNIDGKIVVVTDWLINNTIDKSKYHPQIDGVTDKIGVLNSGRYEYIAQLPLGEPTLEEIIEVNDKPPTRTTIVKEKIKAVKNSSRKSLSQNGINQKCHDEKKFRFENDKNGKICEKKVPLDIDLDNIPVDIDIYNTINNIYIYNTNKKYHSNMLYGKHNNIFLTNDEKDNLYTEFVDAEAKIETASQIQHLSQKKIKNHYEFVRETKARK